MNGKATSTGPNGGVIRLFHYPAAPWEPIPELSADIFREMSTGDQEGAGEGQPSQRGFDSKAELSIPVKYEYRLQPGFELDSYGENEIDEDLSIEKSAGEPCGRQEGSPELDEGRHFRDLLASEGAKAEERGRDEGKEQGLRKGREEGRAQGRDEAVRELQTDLEEERNRLAAQTAALFRSMADARDGYVHALERESARLALAIAARILRREAEADPLLLTGAVRVALGQLAASTVVKLIVPEADASLWIEALARIPNLAIRPKVIGDPQLKLGGCRMETELGSADLGLESQLKEVERGFFRRAGEAEEVPPHPDGIGSEA